MEQKKIREISKKIIKAKSLLEEIGNTPFEGVNAHIKRALLSVDQALFDLGMEEKEGEPADKKRFKYEGLD
jgi:hypothetical protein